MLRSQVVDPEGQEVSQILAGHKKVMAIKSSAFEAMFYGPLKEDKEPILIKETTFEAFKNMLNFLHDIVEDWSKAELTELLHTANLGERYHLPKLKLKVLEHIKNFTVTEDNLLETAATAEEFGCLGLESEALLQACSSFLEDSLITPGDLQKFMVEQSAKDDMQGMVGIRLLTRMKMDELSFAEGPQCASNEEKVRIWKIMSISKKIKKSSNTVSDLIKMKGLLNELENSEAICYRLMDNIHYGKHMIVTLVKSLAKTIDLVKEATKAAGNQVQPEALVEGSITHLQSVQVHLDLITIIIKNGDGGMGIWLPLDSVNDHWDTIVSNTVPAVHDVFFDWLADIIDTDNFDPSGKEALVSKLVLYPGPHSPSYHRLYTAAANIVE